MADPYYASVVLLAVNNNAANGSTTFVDQSPIARTMTTNGSAAYSNTTAPTGMTTVMAYAASGDKLTTPSSTDFNFGSGNFTIEFYVRLSDITTNTNFVIRDDTINRDFSFGWNSTFGFQWVHFVSNGINVWRPGGSSPSNNIWYHMAVVRNGATMTMYKNGVQQGSTFSVGTDTLDSDVVELYVGNSASTAYISNVRITKGVARYTGTFTPPTLPLPTSAVDAPVANFTGTPTSGTTPLSVTLTDSSTNTPTSWLWERTSDGTNWTSFSTSQNPTQSFTTGTWGVRLTATNAGGADTKTRTSYITVADVPVVTPTGGGVPFILPGQSKGRETEEEKLARRIREGTIESQEVVVERISEEKYRKESERVTLGLQRVRTDIETYRQRIETLEAQIKQRETEAINRELLLAQQALIYVEVQQEALLEEMIVLDVAYVALAALQKIDEVYQ